MRRLLYDRLLEWANSKDRRPLLLEGVRQCGKTYLLEQLGRERFDRTVLCNFEKTPALCSIFETDLDPRRIIAELGIFFNTPITPGNTFIILDEIQLCPKAITSLKYFCESAGEFHVAAAGSLLGLLTSKPSSFPVGKVERMTLYPMNFYEFLMADGNGMLAEHLMDSDPTVPLPSALHEKAVSELRVFYTVGGMPNAVRAWTEEHDITKVTSILRQILADYEDDMAKHAGDMLPALVSLWHSIPNQLFKDNNRFMFKEVAKSGRSKKLDEPVQWLVNAGLIIRVRRTDNANIPISESEDENLYKIYMCDVGLLRAISNTPPNFMQVQDEKYRLHKGGLTENHVICELRSTYGGDPHYWSDGRYEVDLVLEHDLSPVPVEIKSERRTRSSSLSYYIEKYHPETAITVSMNEGGKGNVLRIPLYAAGSIVRAMDNT